MTLTILYFAQLAEESGMARETFHGDVADLAALYAALRAQHGFALAQSQLRVARNQSFAAWTDAPADGDEIAFIPPVSGG
ncbi:MAG: MoaD/ThiS family protein [Cardiobacteriaceae bacterium]|nr:MoaD/ThiS family protein [Cardiobacteriaceae bacterium]